MSMITDWLRRHATPLRTTDPDGPVDDLEPLREIVGDARVVAVGEGSGAVADFGGELSDGVTGTLLRWLRAYNEGAGRPVSFAGIDLPSSSALGPLLAPVVACLDEVDSEAVAPLAPAAALAERLGGGSAVLTGSRWTELAVAERDLLSATLGRTLLRVRALAPRHVERGGRQAYDRAAPDTRVVLVAHNFHIQKTPVVHGDVFAAFPMGHGLAREFGAEYRAVALTHTGARVPEMDVAPDASPVGFTVVDTEIGAPAPGTIEAELVAAGLGAETTLTDLRGLPATVERIRAQSTDTLAPMPAAFGAVISTPVATTDPTIPF